RRIEWRSWISWIAVAEEVPGRIDERIHRVCFTSSRSMTIRTLSVYKLRHSGQRRFSGTSEVGCLRQNNRQLFIWNSNHSTRVAVDHWHRRAPETLPGDTPVSDSISDGAFAKTLLFCECGHLW